MISGAVERLAARLRLRDASWEEVAARLMAIDPGLVRLHLALRVTLAAALVLCCLLLANHAIMSLSPAAFAAGLLFAIQGVVSIRDPSAHQRLRTRLLSGMAGLATIALFSLLVSQPRVVDGLFLVVAFTAVFVRRWGPRWTAVGMFSFMASFAGAYFRPQLTELPGIALAIAVTGTAAYLVREIVVRDRPLADLRSALAGVDHRVGRVAALIGEGGRSGWSDRRRRRVRAAHQGVRDAMGVVEAMLPDEPQRGEAAPGETPLAIELFDLNLALESVLAEALAHDIAGEAARRHLADSLRRLARLRRRLRRAAAALTEADLASGLGPAMPARPGTAGPFWRDDATRLALQVTLACALAMAGGMWLSADRWFWAVLTAFLVFTNAQSRGDTAVRALGRAGGTAAGIVAGMGMATLLHGQFVPSLVLCALCTFLAFFFLQASYGTMTFFLTVTLSLVYGLLGNFTPDLLILRLEETVIGTASGTLVSFLVFPQRTSAATGKAVSAFLKDLDRLMQAIEERLDGNGSDWRLYAISRALDRRHAAILAASRPLGRSWASGARRRSVRIGRLRFAVISHWAHRLAAACIRPVDDVPALRRELARCRRSIAAVAGPDFFQRMATPAHFAAAGAPDGSAEDELDPVLAARAVNHTLAQLLPEAPADPGASLGASQGSA
ncbi:FUSC family protein [Aureimonas flava]|uniref:FUSC family protein n=1 Tax=Aureimonas flava TaxID=2320271 RepID=UPI001459FDB3|nr:FUSC family protein [Aureimonas flava]